MKDDVTQHHHDGLPHAETRDFIARELNSHHYVRLGLRPSPGFRDHLLGMIAEAQAKLAAFDKGGALGILMQHFGFCEMDVSDCETVVYDPSTYLPFIGTPDEARSRYPDFGSKR